MVVNNVREWNDKAVEEGASSALWLVLVGDDGCQSDEQKLWIRGSRKEESGRHSDGER